MEKENWQIIKENYEPLRKKHALPAFEQLDAEFDLRKLDKDGRPLREIMIQLCGKLTDYVQFFDPVLDPTPSSLHSFVELSALDKKQKTELTKLYKKLQHLIHVISFADLGGEAEEAKYIALIWEEWPALKKQIKQYAELITKEWEITKKESELVEEYFG